MSRVKNTQLITKDIKILSDNHITNIYDKIWELCEKTGEKKSSRIQKINFIISELDFVPDDELLNITKTIDDKNKYNNMYKILLEVLNLILLRKIND